jgi:transposase
VHVGVPEPYGIKVSSVGDEGGTAGMARPGLMGFIVTSKYADYLPPYRLESIFQRNGLEISRATQSVWGGDTADLSRLLTEAVNY